MTLSNIPTAQAPFELGKHMAKMTVEDSEEAVILLRPRYKMDSKQFQTMFGGLERWKKTNNVALRVLIVPHDFDVIALEVKDGGDGQRATGDAAHCENSGEVEPGSESEGGPVDGTAGNGTDGAN